MVSQNCMANRMNITPMCQKCPKNLILTVRYNGKRKGTVQIWPFLHCAVPVTPTVAFVTEVLVYQQTMDEELTKKINR